MSRRKTRVLIPIILLPIIVSCNRKVNDDRVAEQFNLSKERVVAFRQAAGVSSRNLAQTSNREFRETVRELTLKDLPEARAQYEQLLERSELGTIPAGARQRAVQRLTELKALIAGKRYAVAGVPVSTNRLLARSAGLNPDTVKWVPLGPSEVGGRTRSVIFNPQNQKEMWIGSVAGGIWHSTDEGNSFNAVDDFMKNMVISTLLVDRLRPNVMYAGTGEGFLNSDALRGAGIFRTDDGRHWSQIPGTNNDNFKYVNRLSESKDGKTLLAATSSGVFVSTDSDHLNWDSTPTLPGSIADVIFHPTDGNLVLASGAMDTGEIYHSEDGGKTWHMSAHDGSWMHVDKGKPPRKSRVEIAYALADPNVVYASVDTNNGEVWRSKDSGKSFTKMDSSTPDSVLAYYLGEQGWYDNAVWAGDPKNPDFVIFGGIDIWKSTDGGTTLSPISNWQADKNVVHADQHIIVSSPSSAYMVFVGNDGGLFRTDDIRNAGSDAANTSGWAKIAHNYSVTQFYSAAWSPKTETLIAGAQDNGTLRLSKNGKPEDWAELFGGDGGDCAADVENSDYFYGEYVFLDIFRSGDGGQTADEISGQFWNAQDKQFEWKQPPYVIPDAENYNANFIAPFAIDPNNSNTILAGGASLWRTDDARTPNDQSKGPQWRAIKAPVSASGLISAVAIPKQNSKIAWVGHNNGDIFVTSNADANSPKWTKINGRQLPSRIVTRIVPDPTDMNTVYVTYGGYNQNGARDNVWRYSAKAKSWANISGSLPSVPAFSLTVNPRNRNYVYLATEVGLFASEDMGAHWSPTTVEATNEGPTNAAVMDLLWMNTKLAAATHGRGIFTADVNGDQALH